MNIALCDDEVYETENLYRLIIDYAQKKDYDIHCTKYNSGRELLKADKYDLYFLDYKMDEMDGIEVALALKEKFSRAVTICYLTNFETAAGEVINHQIFAEGFLKKPVDPALLYQKLDRFYLASTTNRLLLKRGTQQHTVYTQDICYIEADGKRSLLHMTDGVQEFNYMISDMEKLLVQCEQFIRIHRSFIISMAYVASFDAKNVILKDGTSLPLKNKNFRAAYRDYLFSAQK